MMVMNVLIKQTDLYLLSDAIDDFQRACRLPEVDLQGEKEEMVNSKFKICPKAVKALGLPLLQLMLRVYTGVLNSADLETYFRKASFSKV